MGSADVDATNTTPVAVAPESASSTAGVLSRPYRALTLGCVSTVLLIAFEAMAIGTAMPAAAEALDGVSLYAFAFSAFFTTSLLGMAVSGQWCDRSGPLGPVVAGIVTFSGGLLVTGTAQTMWLFVAGRALQGAAGGLVIVALYVTVRHAYPERLRPAALAAFSAAWVVPSMIGPVISGTITEQLGWRWVFLGMTVLVVLPLLVMLPALRRHSGLAAGAPVEVPPSDAGVGPGGSAGAPARGPAGAPGVDPEEGAVPGPETTGAVAGVAAGVAAGPTPGPGGAAAGDSSARPGDEHAPGPEDALAGKRGAAGAVARPGDEPDGSAGKAPAGPAESRTAFDWRRLRLAVAVALGGGLLQYGGQDLRWLSLLPVAAGLALLVPSALRLLPRGTFRAARGLPSVIMLRGLVSAAWMTTQSFVPLMLVVRRDLTPTQAGLALVASGMTWALAAQITSRQRFERYRLPLVRVGTVLIVLAVAVTPAVLAEAVPVWTSALVLAVGAFGMGLVVSSVAVLTLRLSTPAEAGGNVASLQVCDSLSNVVMLTTVGTVFAALGGDPAAAAEHLGSDAAAAVGAGAFVAVYAMAAVAALLSLVVSWRLRDGSGTNRSESPG
ncbi:MFS transporter [Streptomyces sp. B6B3]|uniref:MFS transporter n=1 Tax=Streptomyces sp. B6B3 TaxID=3153570 RepID=UPI00325C8E8E